MFLGFGEGFEGGTNAELGFGGEGTLDGGEAAIDADGFHIVTFLLSHLSHKQKRVTDEGTIREAALKFDALGGGAVKVVHRVIDFPSLDEGAFEEARVHRALGAGDALDFIEGEFVFVLGLGVEAHLFVDVADFSQGFGSFEGDADFEFLVGDVGFGDLEGA